MLSALALGILLGIGLTLAVQHRWRLADERARTLPRLRDDGDALRRTLNRAEGRRILRGVLEGRHR